MIQLLFFLIAGLFFPFTAQSSEWDQIPVAYQGRFRPLDAAARLWLFQMSHQQQVKGSNSEAFHSLNRKASHFLLAVHFLGHSPFDDMPLFWIADASLKSTLGLPVKTARFSYNELKQNLDNSNLIKDNQNLFATLKQYEQNDGSKNPAEDKYLLGYKILRKRQKQPQLIGSLLENQFPIRERLRQAGQLLKALPSKFQPGEWLSLKALTIKEYDPTTNQIDYIKNFTVYSDDQFAAIRTAYINLEKAFENKKSLEEAKEYLANQLNKAYESIAGTPYLMTAGKSLVYPTRLQLTLEYYYYNLPLIEITIILYGITLVLFLLNLSLISSFLDKWAFGFLAISFLLHTIILALRCFILGRPPVSNMFETVVYVPWVAVLGSILLFTFLKNRIILIASSLVSIFLLIILYLAETNHDLENVQAVLDSQYWLIVHVLMVVGSYGAFALCGMLGHLYLASNLYTGIETRQQNLLAKAILHMMYIGVALLIPGTILGGVWAAQSWGRFWDWDPKESWAFISSCVYLIWIHSYTFNRIGNFGLAIGSIVGLLAISFTWYGVNYILGTGMHSYGFGNGGELLYYLFGAAELLFLVTCLISKYFKKGQNLQN